MAIGEQAISYVRFSTPGKQALGDSKRRQLERAREWCRQNNVELLEHFTFQDLGVSAFRSKNSRTGQLAKLVEAVRNGTVARGTFLVVEAFDRITRDELPNAVQLLTTLIEAGLRIVTVSDNSIWDKTSIRDSMKFMMAVLLLSRGHEESTTKSGRITANWEQARKTLNRAAFGVFPNWLERIDDGGWQVIPEKGALIRRVYELAIAGYGSYAIAKKLNAEGTPTLGVKGVIWKSGLVSKLLNNRALLGEITFRRRDENGKIVSTNQTVSDFYPRVITDEMFHRARSVIKSRATLPKRRDNQFRNLFFGVAYCGACGAAMLRRNMVGPGRRPGYGRYVCSDTHNGKSQCPTLPAQATEAHIVTWLIEFFAGTFVSGAQLNAARDAVEAAKGKVEELTRAIARVDRVIQLSDTGLESLASQRGILWSRRQDAQKVLDDAENVLLNLDTPDGAESTIDEALAAIEAHNDDEVARDLRSRLHTKLAGLVSVISLAPTRARVHVRALDTYYTVMLTNDVKEQIFGEEQFVAPRRLRKLGPPRV